MKSRPFILALPFGLLTLGLAIAMTVNCPLGSQWEGNPVVELEFANTKEAVKAALNIEDLDRMTGITDTEESDMVRCSLGMDRYFLWAYSAFLAVSCLLAWRHSRKTSALAGAALAILAALFDFLENGQLWNILGSGPTAWEDYLGLLTFFTWAKWGSILAVFLLMGAVVSGMNRFGRVFFWIAVFTGLVAVLSVFLPILSGPFSQLIAALFLLLFLWEASYSVEKPRKA